jgi:phosphonate transport system substrate-binding protein
LLRNKALMLKQRLFLRGLALFCAVTHFTRQANAEKPLQFGLTPVFLSNDLELTTQLQLYLSKKCGTNVQLVQRRTYEEITTLLLSSQLDAAWICGYPFVR